MMEDLEFLNKFAKSGDEAAFSELIHRHVDLVYSTALRVLNGDCHLAEDATQKVFLDLASKASSLPNSIVLPGWLYEASRFTASNMIRGEQRRKLREQEVGMLQEVSGESSPDWNEIAPHLDAAISELPVADRDAVVLRFFQGKDFRTIGGVLGVSDDSAQKRVSRALKRMRQHFEKRGITVSLTVLGGLMTANAVHAAPATLTASLASSIGVQITGTASVAKTSWSVFACSKAKIAVTSVVIALSIAGFLWYRTSAIPAERLRLPVGAGSPKIAMGAAHGIILASDGSLWSWGESYAGWPVLGLGRTENQAALRRIGNDNDWIDVSTSFTHCLALKFDGSIWAWGENLNGQLGLDAGGRRDSHRSQPVRVPNGDDWKQVAAGGSHSLALKTNGTLWAWGNNWAGQLGTGDSAKEIRQITQVGRGTNWVKVWAAGLQSLGLQSDGSLWFWGSLTGGAQDTNRFNVPTRISAGTNWSEVGFGYFTVFAIKRDGTLWVFGRNAGIYTGGKVQLVNPSPARIGTNSDWKAISRSEYFHHLLEKTDGTLWTLDASDHAVVNQPSYKPVQLRPVSLKRDFVAFGAAGRDAVGVALTREGEVWTWGRVLGKYSGAYPTLRAHAESIGWKTAMFDGTPVIRKDPWRLPWAE